MFIVTVTYKVALEQVDKYLPDHVEFLKAQYAHLKLHFAVSSIFTDLGAG